MLCRCMRKGLMLCRCMRTAFFALCWSVGVCVCNTCMMYKVHIIICMKPEMKDLPDGRRTTTLLKPPFLEPFSPYLDVNETVTKNHHSASAKTTFSGTFLFVLMKMNLSPRTTTLLRPLFLEPFSSYFDVNKPITENCTTASLRPLFLKPFCSYFEVDEPVTKNCCSVKTTFSEAFLFVLMKMNLSPRTTTLLRPLFLEPFLHILM